MITYICSNCSKKFQKIANIVCYEVDKFETMGPIVEKMTVCPKCCQEIRLVKK